MGSLPTLNDSTTGKLEREPLSMDFCLSGEAASVEDTLFNYTDRTPSSFFELTGMIADVPTQDDTALETSPVADALNTVLPRAVLFAFRGWDLRTLPDSSVLETSTKSKILKEWS